MFLSNGFIYQLGWRVGEGEASCAVDHNRTEVLLYTLHRYYVCIERPTAVTDPARIALLRATGARITAGVGEGGGKVDSVGIQMQFKFLD
jgi:hypothetical protein